MDLDWQHYHRLNIALLSVIGLWPYDNKARLKRIIGSFFVFTCCFSQLATFVTVDYTRNLLLKNAPCIFVGCGVMLKYITCLAVGENIKRVTKVMNDDWKNLSNTEENQIVKKYIERSNYHTKGFALFICPVAVSLLLAPLSYAFLDIVVPLNESRNRSFPIMFDFFFDQKKYFFLATLVYDGAILVGGLVFVATEALLIVYILHGCALFKVTSYRIKRLLHATGARNSKRSNNMVVIAQVVEIHCRALRHCKTIRRDFLPFYLMLFAFGVLSLATHLFRCAQTLTSREFSEFLTSSMFCFAILGYMFYISFVVQSILISSGDIFRVLYDSEWYAFSTSTRKLILFCMLNSVKPVAMDVCGLYLPSYEGFSQVARMAMSYATTLHHFQ